MRPLLILACLLALAPQARADGPPPEDAEGESPLRPDTPDAAEARAILATTALPPVVASLPPPQPAPDALAPVAKIGGELLTIILVPLGTAIAGLLTALLGLATSWLAGKARDQRVASALTRLGDASMLVVKSLSGTTVAAIKEAAADGKITPAEREKIKALALDELKRYVGPAALAEQRAVLFGGDEGAHEEALGQHIEAAVFDMKREIPAPLVAVTVPPVVASANEIPPVSPEKRSHHKKTETTP